MCSRRLVAFFACVAISAAVESEGTNFVFAFVRNANPDTSNQILSATVLNRNSAQCTFSIETRPDYHKTTKPDTLQQMLPPMSATEISIPSWYGFNYTTDGRQDDLYLTLMANSTCNVTVLANNYDAVTKQGDTYMVLPISWGSTSFTFSLPPAVSIGRNYEQVFILPVNPGYAQIRVEEIGNAQSEFNFNVTYGEFPASYIGASTPDSRPRTYHITSSAPVVIVAGVTCAGTDPSKCDHIAYMPHPQAANDCYSYDYYDDDHISYLPTTSQFFTDIPGSCLVGQNITASFSDEVSRTITIKPKMESPLWSPSSLGNDGNGVAFHNGGSNIHIARYYDGSNFGSSGAFIATSPSITQFHNDYSAFYTRNVNDSVEIYCTVLSCSALKLDTVPVYSEKYTITTQKVDGVTYWIFVIPVLTPGFHQLDLSPDTKGNYAYFVYGKNGNYAYGYEGGVNKPTVVYAPATPGTGTSPTVTTPSSTLPPVTSPSTPNSAGTTGTTTSPTSPSPVTSSKPTIASTLSSTVTTSTMTSVSTQTSSTIQPLGSSSLPPSSTSTLTPIPSTKTTITTPQPPISSSSSSSSVPTSPAQSTSKPISTTVPIMSSSTIVTTLTPVTNPTVRTSTTNQQSPSTSLSTTPRPVTTTESLKSTFSPTTTKWLTSTMSSTGSASPSTAAPPVTGSPQTSAPPVTSSPTTPTTPAPPVTGPSTTAKPPVTGPTTTAAPPATGTTSTAAPPVTGSSSSTSTAIPPVSGSTSTPAIQTVPTTTKPVTPPPATTPTTKPTVPASSASTVTIQPVTTPKTEKPTSPTVPTTTTTTTATVATTTMFASQVSVILPFFVSAFLLLN